FNYIELFYNPKRRRSYANGLSPVEFVEQYSSGNGACTEAGAIQPAWSLLHAGFVFAWPSIRYRLVVVTFSV
ncbi:MAG: hypothetical protein QG660_5, partial [Pseudomonadota bacterium]|nr:hypothetical protein [Pseudomonadota bacterium]